MRDDVRVRARRRAPLADSPMPDDALAHAHDDGSDARRAVLAAVGVGLLFAARAALRRWRTFDLRGRTALVTGGSRGLGLLIARELVAEGAQVAICARDERALARAAAQLAALGGRVMAVPCDVSDPRQVEELVGLVAERFGPVDVLVNNAGAIQVGPVETMTTDDFETEMRTHFWGPFHTMMAVLPEMRRRRNGRIVNVASIGGKVAVPHLVPYSASKFALVGLSAGLRAELAKAGVLVTTVSPGLMRTGSPRNAVMKGRHEAEYAWFSIADATPGLSMSAERAARRIVRACKHGEAEVVLGLPAQLLSKAYGLFPNLTTEALALADRMLPGAEGGSSEPRRGAESESRWSPSPLTTLGDRAAARNNELGG